jgi:hypothetical protein
MNGGGKNVYDFEQIKETVEDFDDRYNVEILSIPNKIKIESTILYMLTHIITFFQLMAVFATLDIFLVLCIIVGHFIGFLMFGFKRRRSFLYIYNPLGSIV